MTLAAVPPIAVAQDGDPARGAKEARTCKACHRWGDDAKNAFGPVLNDVVGRKAASIADYKYSGSLKEAGGKGLIWTEDRLASWLENPGKFLKGYLDDPDASSKMPLRIKDEQIRRDIVAFLKSLGKGNETAKATVIDGDVFHGNAPHRGPLRPGARGPVPGRVALNGRACSPTGDDAPKAASGNTALFLQARGNRDIRPHLISGQWDENLMKRVHKGSLR